MKLIGITGRMGHGKDTVADMLQKDHGYQQVAFADPLKTVLSIIACEPVENFYDRELKEKHSPSLGMTRREAMQLMGTEVCREMFGAQIWTDGLITRWHQGGQQPTVVSDVRFDEEALAIIANGGVILRVVRPGIDEGESSHASEAGIDPGLIKYEIRNESTLQDLSLMVNAFVAGLEG